MSLLYADMVEYTDKLAALYLKARGPAAGDGIGVKGTDDRSVALLNDIHDYLVLSSGGAVGSMGDDDQIAAMLSPLISVRNGLDGVTIAAAQVKPILTALASLCVAAGISGVTNVATFLDYYNAGDGGPWNCLVCPDFATLAVAAGLGKLPKSAYFEVLQGSTYANALAKFVVSGAGTGTLTDGQAIDQTAYAGGFAQVKVSGLIGTGTVTINGIWRLSDGTISGTLTAPVAGTVAVTGTGTTVLTTGLPAANALLLDVVSMSIDSGISAGTIYVEAARPSGRTNPPT